MHSRNEPGQALLSLAVSALVTLMVIGLIATCAPAARADCVWIPVCLPPHDPPYEAMRLYLDGQLSHEYRPMWGVHRSQWSRTNIWACGPAAGVIELSMVLGDQESDRTQMRVGADQGPTCPLDGVVGRRTLGSYYGPIEQLLRAVRRNHAGDSRPVDTDRDGTIRAHDLFLLDLVARRRFADSTAAPCVEDVCP